MDALALATFALVGVTALLAGLNLVLTLETRDVAKATRDLAEATQELARSSREEITHAKAEAQVAQEPVVVLERSDQPVQVVAHRPGSPMSYAFALLRLVNYGGHALVSPLRVTGTPAVATRPADVAGFLPSGGRMEFTIRFDLGNVSAPDSKGWASVPIRVRGQRLTGWRESLYFVTVSYELGADGGASWIADVSQPLGVASEQT